MRINPFVPEGLEQELAKYDVDIIYDDGNGGLKRVSFTPCDPDGRIWIELRPHLVVELSIPDHTSESGWTIERTSIPLERVWVADLSEYIGEPNYPIYYPARWVRGLSGVLQRLTT